MSWYKTILAEYNYPNEVDRLSRNNPYPFKEWFDDNGRDYIPFNKGGQGSQEGVDKYVEAELLENGYQITDYGKGYCSSGNRSFRIGKVLNSLKQKSLNEIQNKYQNTNQEQDPVKYQIFQNQLQEETKRTNEYYDELVNTFVNSSYRTHQSKQKSAEFSIVLSQNPHDVAQMSTGRQWTSCMDLRDDGEESGSHSKDIFCEIEKGGFVAYLIRSDDKEIEDPLARIHIRRFDNRAGQSVAMPEQSVYGNEIKGFQEAVQSWLQQKQGDINPGTYQRQGGEYSDTFNEKMLIGPSNIDDVLKWLRGEGEDAQYSTWSVNDHLFLEFSENYDTWEHYESDMEDKSKTFKIKEEAEKYLEKMNNLRTEMEEYYREEFVERGGNSDWANRSEETGEWEEQRFFIQENKTDHRADMTNDAIRTILKAPKGTYSIDILKEIKDILFEGKIISSPRQGELIQAYPELFSDEEINQMTDTDQLSIFKKLPPERQEQQKEQWYSYLNDALNDPQIFINYDVQQRMKERDMSSDIGHKDRTEDSIGVLYANTLENWLFSPLKEVFKPIPEPIIQKLVNFGMNFTKDDNSIAPYKNMPKYDRQILSRIITTLSQTKSDTPTVQNFYKQMLPLWEDNRETYYDNWSSISVESLGRSIGDLGENGRDFLPFINNKIEEEKEALKTLEDSITPEKREWLTTKDLLKRAYKKIERLYNIKQAIDPNHNDSMRYRWARGNNWYKRAQRANTTQVYPKEPTYLDIGHDEAPYENFGPNYMWVFDNGQILSIEEDEDNPIHDEAFKEIDLNKKFTGRFESSTGKASILKPYNKAYQFRETPNIVLRRLYEKFPIKELHTF